MSSTYVALKDAPSLFPSRPSYSSVHRWAFKGVSGCKLKVVKSGGRFYTTEHWINEFQAEVNATAADRLLAEGC